MCISKLMTYFECLANKTFEKMLVVAAVYISE